MRHFDILFSELPLQVLCPALIGLALFPLTNYLKSYLQFFMNPLLLFLLQISSPTRVSLFTIEWFPLISEISQFQPFNVKYSSFVHAAIVIYFWNLSCYFCDVFSNDLSNSNVLNLWLNPINLVFKKFKCEVKRVSYNSLICIYLTISHFNIFVSLIGYFFLPSWYVYMGQWFLKLF